MDTLALNITCESDKKAVKGVLKTIDNNSMTNM